ncbi:MAG: fatty acid desaturase, partial [Dokdonella sp.]
CETAEDPHSPLHKGIRKVVLDGVALYQQECKNPETTVKYGIGTPDDWIERNVYARFPALGPTLLLFACIALFGVVGVALWALQMVWIPFWAAGVVNGLGHWWGYRNFESPDMSTNLTPWGLIIGGEELHNNHHAFPSSAKFALRKFEVDIGWVAIRLFEAMGLAKVLRVAATLDVRPNVKLPDVETVKAVLSHRVHVLSDYFKGVIAPTLREEVGHAGLGLKALPRKLRKGLANGGRWLDAGSRRELDAVVSERPLLATVCEFRARLAGLLDRNGRNADAMMESLKQWCQEAEASGIRTLSDFAGRLKGYQLAHSH